MPCLCTWSPMENINSCYSDLKISARGKRLDEVLETAYKLGYRRVAIDVEFNVSSKKLTASTPDDLKDVIKQAKIPEGFEVLKRITLCVEDPSLLHVAQGLPVLKGFDLTAIKTGNSKVFQACCSNITTDILSLVLGERLDFTIKRSQANQILERGVVFEVCYTPAIKDQSIRRHTLSNTIELSIQTKGKGIIVSSGAERSIEIRGALDIINFCHLFGLGTEQCKNCITKNCRQALLHSRGRTDVIKGVVSCRPIREMNDRKRKTGEELENDFVFDKKLKDK